LAVNGVAISARFEEDLPTVRKQIADLPVGEEATLTLHRGDERTIVHATTEELSQLKGDQLEFAEWAFTAAELTPEIVQRARLDSTRGVWVSGVQAGGIAAQAGLRPGDIILQVDEADVENLSQFRRTYDDLLASGKQRVLLYVKQGALTRFVLVKQDGEPAAMEIAPSEGGPSDAE
jgi:serine protease Do